MKLKINKEEYNIIVADTFPKKLIGLINEKNITYGLLIPKCNSIHTFFMKQNIDVIGLDNNNEVIYKYENLDKNRVIKIENDIKTTSILELPANSTKKIKVGTILLFEP